MAITTETLTHTGSDLDQAITDWKNTLRPVYTLPEQVFFTAALDPTAPLVHLFWEWENTEFAGGMMIRRKAGSLPEHSADGVLVCDIAGTETRSYDDEAFNKNDLADVGTPAEPVCWYYRAFPYNINDQMQTNYQTTVNRGTISVNVFYLENSTTLASLALGNTFQFGRSFDGATDLVWKVCDIQDDRVRVLIDSYSVFKYTSPFDAPEPGNNVQDRVNYGNNRWSVSNARQWLNSDDPGGSWFEPQTDTDACGSTVSNRNGFLFNFTEAEKGIIIPENHTCVLSSYDGGGSETVIDKVWFPSRTELGLGNENNSYPEGNVFGLFDGDGNTDANRAEGYNTIYWTRTAYSSSASTVRYVNSAGSLGNGHASISCAFRAGLTLPLSTCIVWNSELERFEAQVS